MECGRAKQVGRSQLVSSVLVLTSLVAGSAARAQLPQAHARVDARTALWKPSPAQTGFMDQLQRDTFAYFWKTADPKTGLMPDRVPGGRDASIAAIGFGLTAYAIGVERGYVTRTEAAERTLRTLRFLWWAPQGSGARGTAGFRGFFYHYLDMTSGLRSQSCELSTVDTALLMAGVLSARAFFDDPGATETEIRAVADALYRRVDWPWMYSSQGRPLLSMGWTPEHGFIDADWRGYNEAMLLYLLALGSPTHPVDPSAWSRWTASYQWASAPGGQPYVEFGPLFGYQYSHAWIDFRGIQDAAMRAKGIDYFTNSVRATYANRDYCIHNPGHWAGYGDTLWGLTACDGPGESELSPGHAPPAFHFHAYWARAEGVTDAQDDGTLAPTAAGGSVPFAPEITIPTLELMHDRFGSRLYGEYGFHDAFNLSYPERGARSAGWFDAHYLGIDEGPILLMIENYRSGAVWSLMKRSDYLRDGLVRAGFEGGWLAMQSPRAESLSRSPAPAPAAAAGAVVTTGTR